MIEIKSDMIILSRQEYDDLRGMPKYGSLFGVDISTWSWLQAWVMQQTNMSIPEFMASIKRNNKVTP